MAITVDATYENGVLRPDQPIALADKERVRVVIVPIDGMEDPLGAVIGICDSGPDQSLAAEHDQILYGLRPHKDQR